jgi:hypothetical protein
VYKYQRVRRPEVGRKFRTFLHGRAWTAHWEGSKVLFDQAVGWLRKNRVPLPGVSLPARKASEGRTVDLSPQLEPATSASPSGVRR